MNSPLDRFRRQAAEPIEDEPAEDTAGYRAFLIGRKPGMGFYIALADGRMRAFSYHDIGKNWFVPGEGADAGTDFVSFVEHGGTAVILHGVGLKQLYKALARHAVDAINEHDGRQVEPGKPIVTSVKIIEMKSKQAASTQKPELVASPVQLVK